MYGRSLPRARNACIRTTPVVEWSTRVVLRYGTSEIDKTRASNYGGFMEPGALFCTRNTRSIPRQEEASLHNRADNGLSPGSEESLAPCEEDRHREYL